MSNLEVKNNSEKVKISIRKDALKGSFPKFDKKKIKKAFIKFLESIPNETM